MKILRLWNCFSSCLVLAVAAAISWGQAGSLRDIRVHSSEASEDGLPSGIVWYGKLSEGLQLARDTGRPIFLLSAAPQCAGVPGMW